MSEEQQHKPKIIVDDNWKERVQAEKEALKAAEAQQTSGEGKAQPAEDADYEVPPASFSLLVTSLATQTVAALGQIPDPEQKEPLVRLDVARHHIDILGILEEKTQGNLTPDESSMLSNVLHELRMLYMAAQTRGTEAKSS